MRAVAVRLRGGMTGLFSGDCFGGGTGPVQTVIFGCLFAGTVGVTVGASVRAGVVFADVLAGDTAAEGSLPFVFQAFPDGCPRSGQSLAAYAQKVRQEWIVGEFADDQFVVDTFVASDAELRQVDSFAACGQRVIPLSFSSASPAAMPSICRSSNSRQGRAFRRSRLSTLR